MNVDGSDSQQPSAGLLTSVGIIGGNSGDTYTLDGSLVAAGVTVYIAGGTGAESIVGPNVADMQWTISGVGVGSATSNGTNVVAFTAINTVTGGNLADTFTFLPAGALVSVDGGGGGDTLVAPDRTAANTWIVSADDAGTLNGMPFTRFGSLDGGSGPDNFSIGSGVALSSGVGGGGGDATDTLDFPVGVPTEVDTSFAGPGTGSVSRDGKTVDYSGIELITDELTAANRVLTFSSGNDGVRLDQSGGVAGYFWVQPLTTAGAFATAKLSDPATGLSVQTLAGDDTIQLDSFSPSFTATVSIDGGAGNDSILVAIPSTLAANVTVNGGDDVDLLQDLTGIPTANVSNVEILPTGIPTFTSQGPGPIQGTSAFPTHSGAVQQLAIDPFNSQIIFAGTVNGGVWLSQDGGQNWTPKSDTMPTLAIGSITIAPRDAEGKVVDASTAVNKLVVYAGTGSFGSFGGVGGLGLGVLRSMDGGNSWSLLASSTLSGIKLGAIVALDNGSNNVTEDAQGQIVVVAGMGDGATGGLFRSTDSGKTFTPIVLSAGAGTNATDLQADPGAPGRLYAAVVGVPNAQNLQTGGGIYRNDLRGAGAWTKINAGLDVLATDGVDSDSDKSLTDNGEKVDGAGRIVLSVQPSAGSLVNSVYAALLSAPGGVQLMGVFVSTPTADAGNPNGTWALVGGTVAPPRSAAYKAAAPGETLGFAGSVISRTGGDWRTDGFAVGQQITITLATNAADNGTYIVTAVAPLLLTVAGTVAASATGTATIAGAAIPDATGNYRANGGTLTFGALGAITRSGGSWFADGFAVGETITIVGATDAANNGAFTISALSATILTSPALHRARHHDGDEHHRAAARRPRARTSRRSTRAARRTTTSRWWWTASATCSSPATSSATTSAGSGTSGSSRRRRARARRATPGTRSIRARSRTGRTPTSATSNSTRPGGRARTARRPASSTTRPTAASSGSRSPRATWTILNGTPGNALVNNEIVASAYDPLNDIAFVGTQDAGVASQNPTASDGVDNNGDGQIDNAAEQMPWTFSVIGDGNTVVAVPVFDNTGKITAYDHYIMGNNVSTLKILRYDPSGNVISTRLPALAGASVSLVVTVGGDNKTFTSNGYGLIRNEGPFSLTSTGNVPGQNGTPVTQFFIQPVDANTFVLTDASLNVITFTNAGTGTLTLAKLGGLQITLGADGQTFTVANGGAAPPANFTDTWVMRSTGALPGNAGLDQYYYVQATGTAGQFKLLNSVGALVTFTAPAGAPTLTLLKRFSGLLGWDATSFLSGYSSQLQYTLNTADQRSMALGLWGLYTSTNGLDTLTSVALPSFASRVCGHRRGRDDRRRRDGVRSLRGGGQQGLRLAPDAYADGDRSSARTRSTASRSTRRTRRSRTRSPTRASSSASPPVTGRTSRGTSRTSASAASCSSRRTT